MTTQTTESKSSRRAISVRGWDLGKDLGDVDFYQLKEKDKWPEEKITTC